MTFRYGGRGVGVNPLLSGSGWVATTQAASKGALIVTAVVAARALEVRTFGFLMSLYAVVLVASVIWDFGLSSMTGRDLAAGEVSLDTAMRLSVRARLFVFPIWVVAFGVGVALVDIGHPDALWSLGIFALVSLAHSISTFLEALFHSQLMFRASAAAIVTGRALQMAAALIVVLVDPDRPLLGIGLVFLTGELAVCLTLFHRLRQVPREHLSRDLHGLSKSISKTLQRSMPYAMSGWFKLGYGKADLVMLTALAGALQAGLYAPATRMQDALMVIPAVAVGTLVPLSARAGAESTAARDGIFKRGLLLSVTLSTVAALITFLLIPWLVPFVLGNGFADAIEPARILVWSIPFAGVQAVILASLIARGEARSTTLIHGTALAVTLAGHLALDPAFGAVGGAWASLLREPVALGVALALLVRANRRESVLGPIPT